MEWGRRWDTWSLGTQFRVLFLLAYVPILIGGGALMLLLYVEAGRIYYEQTDRQALVGYSSLSRWYGQQQASLRLLANEPEIRAGPTRRAYHLLQRYLAASPGWQGLSLIDASGRTLLTTFRPFGSAPVDLSGEAFVMRALRTGEPVMSGFTHLPLDPNPMVSLIVPFEQSGKRHALAIHYDPDYIAEFFATFPFQGEVIITMLDREGRRLVPFPGHGPLGERVTSPAVREIFEHQSGEGIMRWIDDVERITAYYHHPPTGWVVIAGIPVSESLGMIRRMLIAILAAGILGFSFVFWLIQLGLRRSVGPIADMVDRARRLGNGELGVRVPEQSSQELSTLGRSFNQMASEIEASRASLEAQVSARTRELTQALHQLKSLDKLKDTFLSTLSHEMKTPLSLIIGYAELLQDKYPDETLLKGLLDGSRRLTTHINNMLDYSALLSGRLPLYKTEVSVPEVARNALDIMETEFKLADIRIEAHLDADVPPICGDSRRITQIFLELLDNAKKHTPAGGTVGVEVRRHDGALRIEVRDTGSGIDAEDLERIWEAFNQLDTEEASRKGGLGLGLTIVKKLTELHHGRVAVESQPGLGSRFCIDLPVGLCD